MCAALVSFSLCFSGCVLSKAVYNHVQLDADIIEIKHAEANEAKLVIEYVITPKVDLKLPYDKQRKATKYSQVIMTPTPHRPFHDKEYAVEHKNELPLINKEVRLVYNGEVNLIPCSSDSKENLHNVFVIRDANYTTENYHQDFVYFRPALLYINMYYFYPPETSGEVNFVAIRDPYPSYIPWYGPLLALTMLPAMVADFIAFPIELLFLPEDLFIELPR